MPLLDTTIRTSVVLVCALTAAALCRRRSAALRHLIVSAAIVTAAFLPLVQRLVPEWRLPLERLTETRTVALTGDPAAASMPSGYPREIAGVSERVATVHSIRSLVGVLWLMGVGLGLLRLLIGLGRLGWIATRAEYVPTGAWTDCASDVSLEYGLRRPVMLLESAHSTLLATWGVRRPKIILPREARDWTLDRIRIVVRHELAHIRRGDWATQMTAELFRAVYWFNPLAWICLRRVRQESEQACDDLVLGAGIQGADYAAHLLELARNVVDRRAASSPALAIARPSSLERRIRAMLTTNVNHKPITRRAAAFVTLACWCVAAPIAGAATSASLRDARLVDAGRGLTFPVKVVRQSVLDKRTANRSSRFEPAGVVAGTTLAQVTAFASFAGTLVDPVEGLLPGATVTLFNPQTRVKQETQSDQSGRFDFAGLLSGDYQFEAKFPGFNTLHRTVTLGAGMLAEVRLQMQIGSIEETVTVTDSDVQSVMGGGPNSRAGQTCRPSTTGGIGGQLTPPVKIGAVRPAYPSAARDAKIEGVVVVQGRIDTSGFVTDLRVVGAPNAELVDAALDAVRGWRFEATLLNCIPVDTAITAHVNFQLKR